MAAPYTAKWGIMATGGIAEKFVGDLLLDPAGRDVNDVRHDVVAVASSTNADRASAFIKKLGCKADTKAYGSYEELVKDANVDIIYVASPHSEHYANTLLALEHGKAVCCEKPFTINAAQTKHLAKVAREKNVFLMEAVWIRFFPLVIALKKLLHQDRILGKIHRVHADFAMHFDEDPKHRLFNPDLGGGALLDLGIYPLTWIMVLLFEDPDNQGTVPTFTSQMLKTPLTGVDAHTTAAFAFEKTRAMGVMTTSLEVESHTDRVVLIQGEKGTITVPWAPFRPTSFSIHLKDKSKQSAPLAQEEYHAPDRREFKIPGHGMFWEADACARALRDGKIEAERCTLQDSTITMTIMDKIRAENDFKYSDRLESTRSDA
ncbi:NAD(P)-binding protein [Acaromyces ingoldii]|uniref:D-xylose 1-dehydrogenase (NADP(+), D-xylono-1,5-lactone-forming) n=1 Tax=Acaromyces ingoldii TaxID=215250 RepID=A0A316YHG8_9BASI|nr:NAD(P)-binding protein [Acaromyces ingoldii]PWN88058.1 NAD(P)-binding protein [Acaromyces ingoldii]